MDTSRIRGIINPPEDSNPPTLQLRADGISIADPSIRYAYWEAQGTAAKWAASWALVEYQLRKDGHSNDLDLQRDIVRLIRRRSA